MAQQEVRINLISEQFGTGERVIAESGELKATAFSFGSGVAGLRMENAVGCIVMLPWQGQQIWSANFLGRELTMKSMFDEPQPTRSYLDTYGAFLLHCGATAMGVPGPEDTHPVHGELPNAPYRDPYLLVGEDADGAYMALGGVFRHTVAFNCNYTAEPLVKLRAGCGMLDIAMTLTNLMRNPMEWMYLAHINFRPVEQGRLVYSAPCDPEHAQVRRSIPSHVTTPDGYREFLEELAADPAKHNVFSGDLPFDPEVCFYLDYVADTAGWAHSLQVHPDGGADYVAHCPEQLEKAIRWIANSGDQAAMGLILPATAEPEGFQAEKEKGNIKVLPGGASLTLTMRAGALEPNEVASVEEKIAGLLR
ncbi:MAG: DUF4432 family protein [Lentisphaeria bacterium]|nr:DUF4432 family protein [Lentisphaeria bacterium]